jgi:drug/metabolite transporter (DMT)-like permease
MEKAKQGYLFLGTVFVLIGAILYSSKAVMVKIAYQYEVDSTSLLTLRMLFSLPFYLVILFWRVKGPDKHNPMSTKECLLTILLGLAGYYLASYTDFVGLQYVSAGLERLILFTYPTMVVLMMAVFYKQKINGIIWLALVMTYIGIGIAFLDKVAFQESANLWKGAFYVFLAAFFYAIYVVGSGQLVKKAGTLRFTSIGMIAAALGIILQHGITQQWDLWQFHNQVYFISFIIAIVATVIPSYLVMEGIKRIGATNAAIVGSVGPISTIVLAYIFLKEQFGWMQLLGTLIVIFGVIIISKNKRKQL